MKLTEREKNLSKGIKETFKVNDATPEEIVNVCESIHDEFCGV